MTKLTQPIETDKNNRAWHVYEREDGSIVVYYTFVGAQAHFVIYDTLDNEEPFPARCPICGKVNENHLQVTQ